MRMSSATIAAMRKTSVYLDDGQSAGLEKLSNKTGVPQASLIRIAIDLLLEKAPQIDMHRMFQQDIVKRAMLRLKER